MACSRLLLILFVLISGQVGSLVNAGIIVDTASGPIADSGGAAIGNLNYVFHRFELTSTTQLTSVGGAINNFDAGPLNIFAAIIALTDSNDLPDSFNLSTPDVLGTTLVLAPVGEHLDTGAISLLLNPGWYALAFGTGKFGSQDVDYPPPLLLFEHTTDLAPGQFPIVATQAGHPFGEFFEQLNTNSRFVVEGVTAVPEPASTLVLLSITGGWFYRNRLHRKGPVVK